MAFWNKSKKPDEAPSTEQRHTGIRHMLDLISLDTNTWQFDGEDVEQMSRQWITSDLDIVSLNFFPVTPNLPATGNKSDFVSFINELLLEVNGRLVELKIRPFAGIHAVYQIVKFPIPNREHGMVYIGSWTLPYKDMSYVIKTQCEEQGMTGMRESLLFAQDRAGSAGHRVEDGKLVMPDWNPDAEEFDAEFPSHPISRLRHVMKHLELTTTISENLSKAITFPLPESTKE
ncbi:hypothetical protein IAD21_04055 [Abditibacteriota bacterium]|nr:hypothetical protein IAD21_04055 [Abditibacteriota bacterium]